MKSLSGFIQIFKVFIHLEHTLFKMRIEVVYFLVQMATKMSQHHLVLINNLSPLSKMQSLPLSKSHMN